MENEFKAYQWALPEGVDAPADELKVRLDFYQESVVMYLLDKGIITTRMVSARDIALALLKEVPLSSGILPEGTLWWRQGRSGVEVALWRPPRVWPVALQLEVGKPPRRFRLPMPGLIFVCSPGRPPRVYAGKRRPGDDKEIIYHAPLFNVFRDGRTCAGTHRYPDRIDQIPESFMVSFFTVDAEWRGRSKRYPDDLLKLWEELDGKRRYPQGDLVPIGKVEDILQ